jgi:excisionase family DNA binding protein
MPDADTNARDRVSDPLIEKHYKTREVAELLGLHPDTIRRAAQRGELDSIRIGLDRIYPASAVRRWLDANREQTRVVPLTRGRQTRASTTRRRF